MRVVVGVSRTVPGLRALRTAVARARQLGAPLWAVRAWEPLVTYGGIVVPRQDAAAQDIDDAFAEIAGGPPRDLRVRRLTPRGQAGPELVAIAGRDSDLLIVGRGGVLRPSAARYCVRHARCPVLVVPADPFGDLMSRRAVRRMGRHELADLPDRYGPARSADDLGDLG